VNQVEALERAILERAAEMAAESRQRAEDGRRDILRESSERLHLREEKETLLAKSMAERAYRRRVQADELKLRSKLDHMRWNLVQAAILRLAERMQQLRQDESQYLPLLQAYLTQAAAEIPGEVLEVSCNAEDRQLLESAWATFTSGLEGDRHFNLANQPIDTLGGLRVATPDHRIQIDHTFEGRLQRLQRKIQQALVERLLPPVGSGPSL